MKLSEDPTFFIMLGGAALVLELPPSYALRSAEGFADGGVELLDRLGCAEALCFGSESGDAETLLATAQTLLSPELVPLLKQELAGGASFPAARLTASSPGPRPPSTFLTPSARWPRR